MLRRSARLVCWSSSSPSEAASTGNEEQGRDFKLSYTNNGLNQTTASGADAITWDARGNLASWAGQAYTSNADNFLRTALGSVSLAYDPMARLKQVVQGSVTTKFGYSGLDLIGEYNASGSLLRRYVHGPGMDNPIVWYEGRTTLDCRFLRARYAPYTLT